MAATQAGLMPNGRLSTKDSAHVFVVPKTNITTNFSPGAMKFTGVQTDLAIEGKAFFSVQLLNGSTAYTRDGEFQLNSEGRLVSKEGYPVLGQAGPIGVNPHNAAPLTISTSGEISQGTALVGKLALTEFEKPEALTQINGGYFMAQSQDVRQQTSTSTVRQGYVEASNSSTVMEMANLMTAMRGFEANQHVIQIQDDRLGKAISDLGSTT